jgi:hypothetical protein
LVVPDGSVFTSQELQTSQILCMGTNTRRNRSGRIPREMGRIGDYAFPRTSASFSDFSRGALARFAVSGDGSSRELMVAQCPMVPVVAGSDSGFYKSSDDEQEVADVTERSGTPTPSTTDRMEVIR